MTKERMAVSISFLIWAKSKEDHIKVVLQDGDWTDRRRWKLISVNLCRDSETFNKFGRVSWPILKHYILVFGIVPKFCKLLQSYTLQSVLLVLILFWTFRQFERHIFIFRLTVKYITSVLYSVLSSAWFF